MKKKISCLSFLTVLLMLFHITAVFAETQTATTQGFGGDVTVTVEVEDGEIVSVKAEGAGETQGVGSVAIDELPAAIVKAQSVAIDGISGPLAETSENLSRATGEFSGLAEALRADPSRILRKPQRDTLP